MLFFVAEGSSHPAASCVYFFHSGIWKASEDFQGVRGACERFLVAVAVKLDELRRVVDGQWESVVGDVLCEELVEGVAVSDHLLKSLVVVAEKPLEVVFDGEDAAWFQTDDGNIFFCEG